MHKGRFHPVDAPRFDLSDQQYRLAWRGHLGSHYAMTDAYDARDTAYGPAT